MISVLILKVSVILPQDKALNFLTSIIALHLLKRKNFTQLYINHRNNIKFIVSADLSHFKKR